MFYFFVIYKQVIGYIGVSSPECALQQPLNTAPKALGQQSSLAEADQINEVNIITPCPILIWPFNPKAVWSFHKFDLEAFDF